MVNGLMILMFGFVNGVAWSEIRGNYAYIYPVHRLLVRKLI
jgi:hypothetical protein